MEQDVQLSDLQLAIMRILWEQGEATVTQVHASLQDERSLAPTTVATILSRLEKRGRVARRTEGRQYFYRPRVTEREVRRSMVADLTHRLFQGDATALVSHLLRSDEIDRGDVERIRELVNAHSQDDDEDEVTP